MNPFFLTTVLHILLGLLVWAFIEDPLRGYLGITLVLTYSAALALGVSLIRMNFFLKALCRIQGDQKRVCLTFDDGPDPETTPYLLDLLAEQKIRATFFCIGKRVRAYPELVKRMDDEGHLVENHTFHHHWWTNFLLKKGLKREIEKTQEAIQEIIGRAPRYFRSPMGLTNPHWKGALIEAGLTLVGWDIRTFDRKVDSPRPLVERVLKRVSPGSILVLHDGGVKKNTLLSITRELILELRKREFSFARIDEE